MYIELKDVTIRVESRSEEGRKVDEQILSEVYCKIRIGLTAVIGPSGCGKTTLLRMIAGRVPAECTTSGAVYYCRKKRELSTWTRMTAYLDQSDAVSRCLTARQCLYYAATFRTKSSKPEIYEQTEVITKRLYLDELLDCKMTELSGGQVKRLKIAMELIVGAPIILLDEPTTGLDNVLAYRVVHFLKEVAGHDRIVVCSIHQPDDRTLVLFEQVMLINSGRIIYSGCVSGMARTIAENGFENADGLEISSYVLDFLNTGRIKYFDADEHMRIVDGMALKNVLIHRKEKIKYVEKRSNEFYLCFIPKLGHIITLCKRELKITFKAREHIPILVLTNLIVLSMPASLLVFENDARKINGAVFQDCERMCKAFYNVLGSLCFVLTNTVVYIHQYRHRNDFLARKEISAHAYSATSHYISTMFISVMYFIPMLSLALYLLRTLGGGFFDCISLTLVALFFLTTVFFVNFLLDVSEHMVTRYILMMTGLAINSYPWIVSHFVMSSENGCLSTIAAVFLQFSPASSIFPTIALRVCGNQVRKSERNAVLRSVFSSIGTRIREDVGRSALFPPENSYTSYALMLFFLMFYAVLSYYVSVRPYCFEYRVNLSKREIEDDGRESVSVCVRDG